MIRPPGSRKGLWILLGLAAAGAAWFVLTLPDVRPLERANPARTTLMELRAREARSRGQRLRIRQAWRRLDEISPYLTHAVLIAEDDTFFLHKGFDWDQIENAIRANLERRRYAYGGSTITQQLARTLYLSPKKSLWRKLREAAIAWRLERRLSKKRILEIYLNTAEWGIGVFGAEAAARAYFGVSAADLTPDQAVALVSVLPSPRRWSPFSEKAFMARRRTRLAERMRRAAYMPDGIPEEEEAVPLDASAVAEQRYDFPAALDIPSPPLAGEAPQE